MDLDPSALIELHLKPDALARFGLPDIAYPISPGLLDAVMSGDGDLPFAEMLYFLQTQSARSEADWLASEPARWRLAELLAPDDERTSVTAAGPDWWLEIGPVDLARPVITIQRGEALIAAIQSREDGSLRIAGYRPLDARSARLLITMALRPHPDDGTVCMRPNNWEYALDCSAGAGQTYAAFRNEAYVAYWPGGMGGTTIGEPDADGGHEGSPTARRPSHVAIDLGVAYGLGEV